MTLHTISTKNLRFAVSCVWITYGANVKKRYNLYLEIEVYDRAEKRAGKGKVSAYVEELIAKDWANEISGELSADEVSALPPDVAKELLRLKSQRPAGARPASRTKGKK